MSWPHNPCIRWTRACGLLNNKGTALTRRSIVCDTCKTKTSWTYAGIDELRGNLDPRMAQFMRLIFDEKHKSTNCSDKDKGMVP